MKTLDNVVLGDVDEGSNYDIVVGVDIEIYYMVIHALHGCCDS